LRFAAETLLFPQAFMPEFWSHVMDRCDMPISIRFQSSKGFDQNWLPDNSSVGGGRGMPKSVSLDRHDRGGCFGRRCGILLYCVMSKSGWMEQPFSKGCSKIFIG
jgi:hypothetical protein